MWQTFIGAQAQAGGSGMSALSGPGGSTGPGGWHPTVLYMLVLTAAEIVAVGFLSRHLLK